MATKNLPLIATKEAARRLNLSPITVTTYARRGRIVCLRDSSGRRLYRPSDLAKFQRERTNRTKRRLQRLQAAWSK